MTSIRRSRIGDRGPRAESLGSAVIAVIFVVVANLTMFGVLAALLLPRSGAEANDAAAEAPAVAMTSSSPSHPAAPARASIAVETLPTPPAAVAPLSVAPGSSLVLARSADRVRRVCAPRDARRVSIAQLQFGMREGARAFTP